MARRGAVLYVAAALVAGEAVAFALPGLAGATDWILGAALVVALAAFGWRRPGFAPAAVFLLGMAFAAEAETRLALLAAPPERGPANARELVLTVRETLPPASPRSRPAFAATAFGVPITVILKPGEGDELPRRGEVWRCRGWLGAPGAGRSRFSGYRLWVTEPGAAVRVAAADSAGTAERVRRLSDDLAVRAGVGLGDSGIASLQRAILLGRRSALPPELKRMFVEAGTVHVFAISGLHVMVVAGALAALLGACGMSREKVGYVVIPCVAAYAVVTGARPSAVRAAVMAGVYFLAPLLGRRRDMMAAWAATAVAVYALRPERVFDVGCTMSFAVTLGIVLWLRLFERIRARFAPGPSAPPPPERDWRGRLAGWLRRMPRILVAGFAVSLAAWVAGVPIAAREFGRFTPGGLLANLAIVWLADLAVKLGMAGLAASYLWMPLAAPFNWLSASCTWAMTLVSRAVAAIPGASVEVAPWSLGACAVWYGAWALAGAAAWFLCAPGRRGVLSPHRRL